MFHQLTHVSTALTRCNIPWRAAVEDSINGLERAQHNLRVRQTLDIQGTAQFFLEL